MSVIAAQACPCVRLICSVLGLLTAVRVENLPMFTARSLSGFSTITCGPPCFLFGRTSGFPIRDWRLHPLARSPNFLYPIATVRFSFRIKLLAQVVLASLFGKPSAKQTNTDEASLQHIVKPERNNPRVISWALAWPKARVCGLALHVSDAVSLGFGNYWLTRVWSGSIMLGGRKSPQIRLRNKTRKCKCDSVKQIVALDNVYYSGLVHIAMCLRLLGLPIRTM